MDAKRLRRLTRAQLVALRMLPRYGSYKAIANQLQCSEKTVENHIAAARKTLGIADRFAAAWFLVDYERSSGITLGGSNPIDPALLPPPSTDLDSNPSDRLQDVARDIELVFDTTPPRPDPVASVEEERWHALHYVQIVALIAIIAVAVIAIIAASLPAAQSWSALANQIKPFKN